MLRELIRIVRSHETGFAMVDKVANAIHPGGDARHPGRHSLQNDVGHPLVVRREQEYIAGAHQFMRIWHPADKADRVLQAEPRRLRLEIGLTALIPARYDS